MVGLPPEIQRRLVARGRVRSLRRGERLIHEGLSQGAVIVVLEGTLRVTRLCGDDEIVLAIRGPGDLLGDLGPITEGPAAANVIARESGSVGVLAASRFKSTIAEDPEVAIAVTTRLVELLAESDKRRTDSMCRDVAERIAAELLHLSAMTASSSVTVTQAELAALCLVSRSSVLAVLADLRESGVIATHRGSVSISDSERLESLAQRA